MTFTAKISTQIPFISYTVVTPRLYLVLIYYILLFISNYIYSIYNTEKSMLSNMQKKILKTLSSFKKRISKANKKKFIIAVMIFMIVIQIPKAVPNNLRIYFVDVGQGDCCLILTPKNKSILIDGGGSGNNENYDVGKQVLLPYLLDRRINKVDYIIVSHFDSDHVGGLLTVMEELKVGTVIISKQGEDSENYKKFKQIIKTKKIKLIVVGATSSRPQILKIEKNLYFDILWPNDSKLITENVLNNNSIVCKLHYTNFSMLFTGDIEEIAEKQILEEYKNNISILNSTILKVAHHGSKTSSIKEFIEAVKPQLALIGVGENNKFGHPNDEIIKRLQSLRRQNLPYRSNGRNFDNSK